MTKRLILISILICSILSASPITSRLLLPAIPAAFQWVVRTDGADTNGGGYRVGGTGTDFSNQAAAAFSGSNLASTNGTTNPCIVTSATHNFVATDVDNGLQITNGTNWTQDFYYVVSVAANAATLDKACGSAASISGGTWALGGSLLTLSKNLSKITDGNTTAVKSGTYTITSELTVANIPRQSWIGFGTSPNDGGTAPLVTTATNSVTVWGLGVGVDLLFRNMSVSSTAGTRGDCFSANHSASTEILVLDKVTVDGCNVNVRGDFGTNWSFGTLIIKNSIIKNAISHNVFNSGNVVFENSYVFGAGGNGFKQDGSGTFPRTSYSCLTSTFYNNAGAGFEVDPQNGNTTNINFCNFINNGAEGVKVNAANIAGTLANSVLYGNTTYGANAPTLTAGQANAFLIYNNACGANGTACYNNLTSQGGDVTGISDPFVGRTSNNFALSPGGITAIGSQGFPGVTFGMGTGSAAIGALQPASSGGSGGNSAYVQ